MLDLTCACFCKQIEMLLLRMLFFMVSNSDNPVRTSSISHREKFNLGNRTLSSICPRANERKLPQ